MKDQAKEALRTTVSRVGALWYKHRSSIRNSSYRDKPPVVYVGDTDWVLSTIGENIRHHLGGTYNFLPHWLWRGVRRSVVHFGSPPAYFGSRLFRKIHPSNRQVVSWTHGQRSNPDPDFGRRLDVVLECCAFVDRIVCHSKTAMKTLAAEGADCEILTYVPHGIDSDLFRAPQEGERSWIREMLGIPQGSWCIGSFQKDGIGMGEGLNPKWVKGPDLFLAVIERLQRDCDIFVLLTGPGRGYVKAGLERMGIPYRHVHVPSYRDMVVYYWALDAYLICSRDEGGPMALLESMATGVPVVSTRVGMCADLIESGTNGLLAGIDDLEGLTSGVSQVLNSEELRRRLSLEGRVTARRHDWQCVSGEYDRLVYRPLVKEAGYNFGA